MLQGLLHIDAGKLAGAVGAEWAAGSRQDDAADISSGFFPSKHWKIAQCSLSMGKRVAPLVLALSVTIYPPVTRTSLLARPMVLPGIDGGKGWSQT